MNADRKIPVILDTDIGLDIDDTWALAMLLKMPQLITKMIVSATGDTLYRAKLIARILEETGRADIAIGVGVPEEKDCSGEELFGWADCYSLAQYPGCVREDGAQAIVDLVMSSREPVTIIGIGPATNIKRALDLEPAIAPKADFVGMFGSIRRKHYDFNAQCVPEGKVSEYNVNADVAASKAVFAAPWRSMTITPLDTCAGIILQGERYKQLLSKTDPMLQLLLKQYAIWANGREYLDIQKTSSVLYDTVAVYLAATCDNLVMQEMSLLVDDEGYLIESPDGSPVRVAMDWINIDKYYEYLLMRLISDV